MIKIIRIYQKSVYLCSINNNKNKITMTLQELKENRETIIATITELKGESAVKNVMAQMLRGIDCCETLEELISDAIYMEFEYEEKPETSKLAAMMGAYKNSNNIEFNTLKKEFVKDIH